MNATSLLDVTGLSVRTASSVELVSDASFSIEAGECLALVGESGSGKSMTAKAIAGLLPAGIRADGAVTLEGRELLTLTPRQRREIAATKIGFVFQDAMSALHPLLSIREQMTRPIRLHLGLDAKAADERVLDLLDRVGIRQPREVIRGYIHQLSGGMRQRVMIAMAISCDPQFVIADEPTTALDAAVQARILDLLTDLRESQDIGMLLISHDLPLVSRYSDRVAVMYGGSLIEIGSTHRVLEEPERDYTKALLAASPERSRGAKRLPMIVAGQLVMPETAPSQPGSPQRRPATEAPALEVSALTKTYRVGRVGHRRDHQALDGVTLSIPSGTVMGLVGESGSGKSTLGRIALGLIEPTAGSVRCLGEDLAALRGAGLRRHRRRMQMIFQDSASAFNPRMTLEELLTEPLRVQGIGTRTERIARAASAADEVGLSRSWMGRLPHEFSGGQRQRIAIARALVLEPEFVVADEPVSALDVSIQAQVLNLMKDIQEHRGLSMLFISHDMAVVDFISDDITVLYHGRIVEQGSALQVMNDPESDYTKSLIAATRID